jgi:hypothetical protein
MQRPFFLFLKVKSELAGLALDLRQASRRPGMEQTEDHPKTICCRLPVVDGAEPPKKWTWIRDNNVKK